MSKAPFIVQPALTQIAIAYRNPAVSLIADAVLPRVIVGSSTFKYTIFGKPERFTIPSTLVGRKGRPNQVDFSATETESSTRDYGLDDPVPQEDIDNAKNNPAIDPLGAATEGTTDLILLDREVRVANLVFSAATYPTGNKTTLSGTSQWSDYDNSDPVQDIIDALDSCMIRPNVLVLGPRTWTILRAHPKIIAAVYPLGGNAATGGMATRQAVADLFELEEILVGASFFNTAKKGQAASYDRVWGKHAALIHRNRQANTNRGVTFGFTAQFGGRIAGTIQDPNIGLKGGTVVRVGEQVRELVVAPDAGFFFENAVA